MGDKQIQVGAKVQTLCCHRRGVVIEANKHGGASAMDSLQESLGSGEPSWTFIVVFSDGSKVEMAECSLDLLERSVWCAKCHQYHVPSITCAFWKDALETLKKGKT